MSQDEGPEDEIEMTQEQQGMLEQMLHAHAIDHYNKAVRSPGGIRPYFQNLIADVTQDYKNQRLISRSIYDFSVDRYIFYKRHLEMDTEDAIACTYMDTFKYLIELKNEFPMLRPPMRDDWRH